MNSGLAAVTIDASDGTFFRSLSISKRTWREETQKKISITNEKEKIPIVNEKWSGWQKANGIELGGAVDKKNPLTNVVCPPMTRSFHWTTPTIFLLLLLHLLLLRLLLLLLLFWSASASVRRLAGWLQDGSVSFHFGYRRLLSDNKDNKKCIIYNSKGEKSQQNTTAHNSQERKRERDGALCQRLFWYASLLLFYSGATIFQGLTLPTDNRGERWGEGSSSSGVKRRVYWMMKKGWQRSLTPVLAERINFCSGGGGGGWLVAIQPIWVDISSLCRRRFVRDMKRVLPFFCLSICVTLEYIYI